MDISKREHLDAIAEQHGVPTGDVTRHDARLQRDYDVQVSPSLVLNEGRQHLNGNVGYRVIEANVRELLHKPADEMSWC